MRTPQAVETRLNYIEEQIEDRFFDVSMAPLLETAQFFELPATGEVLAEVPERPFQWWAIGATRIEALEALWDIVTKAVREGRAA